jgi:hypothetical protein
LGTGVWKDFYSVCDEPEEISVYRPFYPDGGYTGRRKQDLYNGLGVSSLPPLLRECERGGAGRREACCLFWTLGGNQVGKAALIGWQHVLSPALSNGTRTRFWPFDGQLQSLFLAGTLVVAETYPAECYRWFDSLPVRSKGDIECRKKFGKKLLSWAEVNNILVDSRLEIEIRDGFPTGHDDAFDAVVGLFGMLQVCFGQRHTGEPDDEAEP